MNIALALIFSAYSQQFKIPPGLLESLCFVESKHNPDAVHKDDGKTDSLGICQVKLNTARWLGFTGDAKLLMRPDINIFYAAKYLGHQLKRYRGDLSQAVIAYNQGSARSLTSTKYSDKVFTQWTKWEAQWSR